MASASASLSFNVPKKLHAAVIGKGGANTKRLQSEFSVRTNVPKQDSDSRVVTFSGPSANLQPAVSEMNRLLGWSLANDPIVGLSIEVPKNKHSALIGPSASILKTLESNAAGVCAISFPDRQSPSTTIAMEGTNAAIDAAIGMMEKIIGSSIQRSNVTAVAAAAAANTPANPVTPSAAPASSAAASSVSSMGDAKSAPFVLNLEALDVSHRSSPTGTMDVVRLQIPKSSHHLLIGPNGATAKRLEDRYSGGLRIRLPPASDVTSNEVMIVAPNKQIAAALTDIANVLGVQRLSSAPIVRAQFHITQPSHGLIVGSHGSTLQSIERSTGVRITVPKKDERSDIVTVEGTNADITAAKAAVEKLIQTSFSVTFSGGSDDMKSIVVPQTVDLNGVKDEVLFFPDVADHPASSGHFQRFLTILRSATKTADIAIYTLTDDRITRVIEDLFLRTKPSVSVRILTETSTINDTGADIRSLMTLGVPVKADVSPFLMHHKIAVLDGRVVVSGSFNWTRAAATGNKENVVVLTDKGVVQSFAEEFARLWGVGETITPANIDKLAAQRKNAAPK